MGSVNHKGISSIGNMSRHGSEGNSSSEWESSKSSHVEVVGVNSGNIILKRAVDLIATQRAGNKGLLAVVSGLVKGGINHLNQFLVSEGTGESLNGIWESLSGGGSLDGILIEGKSEGGGSLLDGPVYLSSGRDGGGISEHLYHLRFGEGLTGDERHLREFSLDHLVELSG